LLDIALLKSTLNKIGVDFISHRGEQVKIRFSPKAKPDVEKLLAGIHKMSGRVTLERGIQPQMVLRGVSGMGSKALEETLAAVEKMLT